MGKYRTPSHAHTVMKLVWVCSLSVGSPYLTLFFSHSTYLFATNAVNSIEFLEARLSFEKKQRKNSPKQTNQYRTFIEF